MKFCRIHIGMLMRTFAVGVILLTLFSCWILIHHTSKKSVGKKHRLVRTLSPSPRRDIIAQHTLGRQDGKTFKVVGGNPTEGRMREIRAKVLLVTSRLSVNFHKSVTSVLEANRFEYQLVYFKDLYSIQTFSDNDVGKFSVVVFERVQFYFDMDIEKQNELHAYCREFGIGIVLFTEHDQHKTVDFESFHLRIHFGVTTLTNVELNPSCSLLRLTKSGGVLDGALPGQKWSVFISNHSTYETVELASKRNIVTAQARRKQIENTFETPRKLATVLHDRGLLDGIHRVYFGSSFQLWLHKLLFLDALALLSRGKLARSLDRWLLVDIDDIFVGRTGTRMNRNDVKALISAQDLFQKIVPGFKFNLGFSSYYFLHGNEEEDGGDEALVENANKFWWFDHTWKHVKPHKGTSLKQLVYELKKNLEFAKAHNINVSTSYAVAPHHSGVYPAHDILYEAWRRVYDIKVTSTEEYPHYQPARKRRGFIYKGIKVLPRQTCGLWTHTFILSKYPKGPKKLQYSIHGGELFQTIINNPISIFMTHLSNYGHDRLALYTFTSVINYIQQWTHLKLQTERPEKLADMYFDMFPKEREPIWQNPCSDKRHANIKPINCSCKKLPTFLVIGPQKTGTTALYTFLSMHPYFLSSDKGIKTYEEVQFFNGRNYLKGLSWYMDYFPNTNNSKFLLFEKSANYFDSPKAAVRVHALLPKVKLITILTDPVKRAHSWYQHVRGHVVKAAMRNSFHHVLTKSQNSTDKTLRILGSRCLVPGLYYVHLRRWLELFPPSQILILDDDKLKSDPISVMAVVQKFLQVKPIDYNTKLRYDTKKKFYCPITSDGKTNCLGKGKGRRYPQMGEKAKFFLENYYKDSNKELAELLVNIQKPIPDWLQSKLDMYNSIR